MSEQAHTTTGKARGLKWGLADFLYDQADLHELVCSAILARDFLEFTDEIEKRLRVGLEDDDVTHDLAAEFANEREES